MAPLLEAAPEPLLHGVGPMPHAALQGAFDGLYPAGDQWYWRADFVNEIPDEAIEIHAKFGAAMPTWKSTMHLYPIDGAVHDVGAERHRLGVPRLDVGRGVRRRRPRPGQRRRDPDWSIDYFEALHPYSAGGAYVNMMMDEGQERVKASYRGNYDRLARDQGDVRPGQRLPGQPEHCPGLIKAGIDCSGLIKAGTNRRGRVSPGPYCQSASVRIDEQHGARAFAAAEPVERLLDALERRGVRDDA